MKKAALAFGLLIALGCAGCEKSPASYELTQEQELRQFELLSNVEYSTLVGTSAAEIEELLSLADEFSQNNENGIKQYRFFMGGANDDGTDSHFDIIVEGDCVIHYSYPVLLK